MGFSIWAMADLHLSFSVPEKKMDIFGPEWVNYAEKMEKSWRECVGPNDLVLIAGDISWAMRLEQAVIDLKWIGNLPGTKVMIKGNHDLWWGSLAKLRTVLPSSCHVIQNDAFNFGDISVAGARLWDTPEYSFEKYIDFKPRGEREEKPQESDEEKIFERELQRLEMSLKALNKEAKHRLVMTHYPPISATLEPSRVSALLEKYGVEVCVFGHLHSLKKPGPPFGEKSGVRYLLTACDYLDFKPLKIL